MHLDTVVPRSRRVMLAFAGLGSAILLAMTAIGAMPALGDTTGGGGFETIPVQFGTIPKGKVSVTLEPGLELLPTSAAICTLQSDPGPRSLKYVKVNPTDGTYTVYLNQAARTPVTVACTITTFFPPISGPISGPKR